MVQLIVHFNDAIIRRVIRLLEHEQAVALPSVAAYLSLGSEGRHEKPLRTDHDSAMVV